MNFKRELFIGLMLVLGVLATCGQAATDDADTIALWHGDVGWYYITFVMDDHSAGYRNQDLLLLGSPSNYADANYVPAPIASDCPAGDANALQYDGIKSRSQSQYPVWVNYNAMGVDMYFKPQKNTGTQTLIEVPGAWNISLNNANAVLTVYTSGSSRVYTVANAAATLNAWHHVVASCSAAGNVSFQVDALAPQTGSGAALATVTDVINVGHSSGTNLYQGILDEIKVSSPGWASSRAPSDSDGTWALWHMDSAADSNVPSDASENPTNTLQLGDKDKGYAPASKPTLVSPGVTGSGSALSFDGTQTEANAKAGWPGYNKFNVDFWFKPDSTDPNGGVLLQAGSVWGISTSAKDAGNANLAVTIWTAPSGSRSLPLTAVAFNQWHHVIVDVNANGHIILTVDGGTPTVSDGLPILPTATTLSLGNKTGIQYYRWYKGLIDEVKITGASIYVPPAMSPLKDGNLTKGLWHFNSIDATSQNFLDDDVNHPTRNADALRYIQTAKDTSSSQAPLCVDPNASAYSALSGVGYPSGNPAFGNCAYFPLPPTQTSVANCQIADSALNVDANNLSISVWLCLPTDFRFNNNLINTTTFFDRWNQVVLRIVELAGTSSNPGRLQFEATFWDQINAGKNVVYTIDENSIDPYAWNKYQFTYSNSTAALLIDGQQVGTRAGKAPMFAPSKTITYVGCRYSYANGTSNEYPFYGYMDDLQIGKAVASGCGDNGYSLGDLNQDCMVDFKDVQIFATNWLNSTAYTGSSGSSNYPNIVEQHWADTGNYNIPQATITPTFPGAFNAAQWTDARAIEMIAPTLETAPNIGTVHGTAVPTRADYSCVWYAKWDNNYLYIAGVIDDNDVNTGTGFDEPQVMFNLHNDPNAVFESKALIINFTSANTFNTNTGPTLSNSVMTRTNNPTGLAGYTIAARFAWNDIAVGSYTPALNDKHGFGFFCQDYNMSGARTHVLCDFAGADLTGGVTVPSRWNTITLVNTITSAEKLAPSASTGNLNGDYSVDFKDLAKMAANWLVCTDPSGAKCHN